MNWNFEEGLPIYTQIVEQMKVQIASGAYRPGDQVPPVRELALEAGVNPNTMQRALAELERGGLLHSERTSGRFITEEKQALDELRQALSQTFADDMIANFRRLGMEEDEILRAVKRGLEKPAGKAKDKAEQRERREQYERRNDK